MSGNQIFSSGKIGLEAHSEATYTQDKQLIEAALRENGFTPETIILPFV